MTTEQDPTHKKIADMTTDEMMAASGEDPVGDFKRACDAERPRAEQQVMRRLQRLRQIGREGLTGSET